MTMRSYRYFACSSGHRGEECTSENDQPYSKGWESVDVTGMRETKQPDALGYSTYLCGQCGQPMTQTKKPT